MQIFKSSFFLFFFLILSFNVFPQQTNKAYLDYIDKYHELAVIQQKVFGIPASITLAQGLLESGAGLSDLSKSSNNHFGIKCHDWNGDVVFQDDDEKNECFRKYNKVLDSYNDHSLFLRNRPRYSFLFQLSPDDYLGWARGLKKAGYATDPGYADKIITIIENYDLHRFDKKENIFSSIFSPKENEVKKEVEHKKESGKVEIGVVEDFEIHPVYKNNHLRFVVSVAGDSFEIIADEFNISEKRLRSYNEVSEKSEPVPGSQIYLQSKRCKAASGNNVHVVKEGESMYSISQNYGIKLERLYKMNKMSYIESATIGQVIKLR